jgi:hypothetical protein
MPTTSCYSFTKESLRATHPHARHRRGLAEPSREPKKLSPREQRTALRAELGLPPEQENRLCVQKTERVTRNLCSVAPQQPCSRRGCGSAKSRRCRSRRLRLKGLIYRKAGSTRCYLTPLRIEGQPFSDPPPRPAATPGLCRLGTRKPLLHSSPVACRPPPRRSRNPAHARKRSPPCKSCLKTCLVLCDFCDFGP